VANNIPLGCVPTDRAEAQALANPGGYVYEIDNSFGPFSDDDHIPPQAIIGAWQVDESGQIKGGFIPNENYIAPIDPMLPKGVKITLPPPE
jgi:hypothetical protein